MPANQSKHQSELDLALLWLPHSSTGPLMVAALYRKPVDASSLSVVIASGYPTPLQMHPDGPPYTERSGLLVPLLSKPLQGGFNLAYTAAVEKGMSGGAVFVGGELIGINGAHANPLWPGQWKTQQGKAVDKQLNDKLELVSLGIAWPTIQSALKALRPPKAAEQNVLVGLDCGMPRLPSPIGNASSKVW